MKARRVVVLGAGVAGTAAAWAASEAGATVVVLSQGPGASSLLSGALDLLPWEIAGDPLPPSKLSEPALQWLEQLAIWRVRDQVVRVASKAAVTRPARGADRGVLDLQALTEGTIAVPRQPCAWWDADLLARGWSADPWAVSHRLRFVPVDSPPLFSGAEQTLTDVELARWFDEEGNASRVAEHLRKACEGHDAILLGPWLGVEKDGAALLREALGKPVGETLSMLAGTAGRRFEHASERLLSRLQRVNARADSVTPQGDKFLIGHHGEGSPLEAEAVVIACGGLIGGGLLFTPAEAGPAGDTAEQSLYPFSLSFESNACLALDRVPLERVASLQGPNLEDFRWPLLAADQSRLEQVGVFRQGVQAIDRTRNPIPHLFVAGSAAAGATHTALAAVQAGIDAGRAAAS